MHGFVGEVGEDAQSGLGLEISPGHQRDGFADHLLSYPHSVLVGELHTKIGRRRAQRQSTQPGSHFAGKPLWSRAFLGWTEAKAGLAELNSHPRMFAGWATFVGYKKVTRFSNRLEEIYPRSKEIDLMAGNPMAPIIEAKTFAKLFEEFLRFAVRETKAERAVLLFDTDGLERPPAQSVSGFDEDVWEAGEVYTAVVERVMRLGRADLIQDARELEALGGDSSAQRGLSALCIPLRSSKTKVRGVLYLDHSQANFFKPAVRDHLVNVSAEFDLRYATLSQKGEEEPRGTSRAMLYVMFGLAFCLVAVGLYFLMGTMSPT